MNDFTVGNRTHYPSGAVRRLFSAFAAMAIFVAPVKAAPVYPKGVWSNYGSSNQISTGVVNDLGVVGIGIPESGLRSRHRMEFTTGPNWMTRSLRPRRRDSIILRYTLLGAVPRHLPGSFPSSKPRAKPFPCSTPANSTPPTASRSRPVSTGTSVITPSVSLSLPRRGSIIALTRI